MLLRCASVSVDLHAPACRALRAACGSLPSGCPRRLGVFPSLRSAIALVFHVLLHCAWHRWARSGCNAGRGASEAGLSILKEFRPRCSLDDDPALAAILEAVLRAFSFRYARIWEPPRRRTESRFPAKPKNSGIKRIGNQRLSFSLSLQNCILGDD